MTRTQQQACRGDSVSRTSQQALDDDSQSDAQGTDVPRKCNLGFSGMRLAILIKAQNICEDACLFEDPFPDPHQDVIGRVESWKSASRHCGIKGEIPDMNNNVDKYVSNTARFYICSNIM